MSRITFYDDPIEDRRVAYDNQRRRVGFVSRHLLEDCKARASLAASHGVPFAEWKDGQVIGDPAFLPSDLLGAILSNRWQEIRELTTRLEVMSRRLENLKREAR